MAPPITTRAALLRALAAAPGYGLQLIERVSESTDGVVNLNPTRVYAELHVLERDGLVESYEREEYDPRRRGGGKPRRWYELTADGKQEWQRIRKALGAE